MSSLLSCARNSVDVCPASLSRVERNPACRQPHDSDREKVPPIGVMPPGHFENTNSTKIATGVALIRLFFTDRKSTRLNSSHLVISYAVFCLKKKKKKKN